MTQTEYNLRMALIKLEAREYELAVFWINQAHMTAQRELHESTLEENCKQTAAEKVVGYND